MNNAVGNTFINDLFKNKSSVNIFLQNGIKLQGVINSHDDTCLILDNSSKPQLVYKNSISTILPS